jgi:methylphosphotriester-DNA--protein-cysteine methyltransferase
MRIRGTIGGHRKTRIYGRLDCPSALRAIANGGYVEHRVFFADEAAAIAAGYRPCARCMPERYKEWKEGALAATQNDHVVDPSGDLAIGSRRLPLS